MKKLVDMTEPELKLLMMLCARTVENFLTMATMIVDAHDGPRTTPPQFVLLVFDDPKVAQYISSCQREDVIVALHEAANRLEAGEDIQR